MFEASVYEKQREMPKHIDTAVGEGELAALWLRAEEKKGQECMGGTRSCWYGCGYEIVKKVDGAVRGHSSSRLNEVRHGCQSEIGRSQGLSDMAPWWMPLSTDGI